MPPKNETARPDPASLEEDRCPSANAPSLGLSFATMLDWWMSAMEINARAHGQPTFTRAQGLLLGYISLGEHRPARLAEKLGVSRPAVHFLINRLVEQGALHIRPDPQDRRAQLVDFPAGNADHKSAYLAFMVALENRIADAVGPEDFRIFRSVLCRDWGDPPLLSEEEVAGALTSRQEE